MDLNLDGADDPSEPGVATVEVALDGGRTATTDGDGRFEFAVTDRGLHTVALVLGALGARLAATSATEQRLSVAARATAEVSFGVTNFGSVAGRVYNDLALAGASGTPLNNPGLVGVRVRLDRSGPAGETVGERMTDASGSYVFSNLPPGSYSVAFDPATVPLDFRAPEQTSWTPTVAALQSVFVDVPVAAERAIAGIVFRDRNANGKFDEGVDEPVAGARVAAGASKAVSGANGRFLLRHLPAGAVTLRTLVPSSGEAATVTVTLGSDPVVRRGLEVPVNGSG